VDRLPPPAFVAGAMDRTMVDTAERHREFIARLAAERTRLRIAQVMRIGWLATTDITPWRGNGEHTLVDALRWLCACAFNHALLRPRGLGF